MGSGFKPTDTPAFLALNPNAMVPVIQDDDFTLWESNTIIRYLAARYGNNALYPVEARARARVDQWIDWQASDLNSAWRYAFLSLVRRSPASRPSDPSRSVPAVVSLHGDPGETASSNRGYVAGPHFSLADIPIGLSVNRWLETPYDRPPLPP